MVIIKRSEQLQTFINEHKKPGIKIGFVPTMGALHEGHLSLIRQCRQENDLTVCSVFVNPTQFNNPDDLAHYPVTIEKDIEALLGSGTDVLFLPPVTEVYPPGYSKKVYPLGELETLWEGHYRPGHFQGVCQVMDLLLNLIPADNLYMGQKDFQQCMVVQKLLAITGRTDSVKMKIVPTVREASGLAMSSRNMRLSPEQKKKAPMLFEMLDRTRKTLGTKPAPELIKESIDGLTKNEFVVDYFAVVEQSTLKPILKVTSPSVILVAAWLGNIRLIDNLIV